MAVLSAVSVATALLGCGATNNSRSGLFEPFRVDLPQGNYITQEMLAQIRTGMTADQVRFALGAPLLNSLFQPDIWSYVFRYRHAGGKVDLRRLVIHFKDQRVVSMEGDDLPASEDGSDPFLPGYKGPQNNAAQK
jgi:outer membrane protein assembly factor BamE